jgi:hypothetical protein
VNQRVQKARGSLLTPHSILILFTRAAPHTKNKGLLINVPLYPYTFLHAQRRVQKVMGSRSTPNSILIHFTRAAPCTKSKGLPIDVSFYPYNFYTCSAAYKKQGAPNHNIIILFRHSNHQHMKNKGHLYTYIPHPSIQQNHFHTSLQINKSLL